MNKNVALRGVLQNIFTFQSRENQFIYRISEICFLSPNFPPITISCEEMITLTWWFLQNYIINFVLVVYYLEISNGCYIIN